MIPRTILSGIAMALWISTCDFSSDCVNVLAVAMKMQVVWDVNLSVSAGS